MHVYDAMQEYAKRIDTLECGIEKAFLVECTYAMLCISSARQARKNGKRRLAAKELNRAREARLQAMHCNRPF